MLILIGEETIMDKENQVREHVRELRIFYTNLVVYGGVSLACIFIWLMNGGGAFWPIWPMMGFAIAATLQGIRLGTLKSLESWFPFLNPNWEDDQVKKMLKNGTSKTTKDDGKKAKDKSSDSLSDTGE
jgi:hypothetical protein